MKTPTETLAARYKIAHNEMRSIDGLQPSEALDELLKYLLVKVECEKSGELIDQIDVFSDVKARKAAISKLRKRFSTYVEQGGIYAKELFHTQDFRLSDDGLAKIHEVLGQDRISDLRFDVRSAALRTFLSPNLRKGLGIFLTPDEVVSEIVSFFDFKNGDSIVDPACGSGTFLMEVAKEAKASKSEIEIIAIDKSPRMMLLTDLNLGLDETLHFQKRVCDTLRPKEYDDFLPDSSADFIITNPPFGVTVDAGSYDLSSYETARSDNREASKRISSEFLFLERCLSILKPGGIMGIVLPRSAVNTAYGNAARESLGKHCAVKAIITLPPETFGVTGTMTNTIVLFVQKYGKQLVPNSLITPAISRIANVGFDTTGRVRAGNQLPGLGRSLQSVCSGFGSDVRIETGEEMRADKTLVRLPDIVKGKKRNVAGSSFVRLGDLVTVASTGATPARQSYADEGLFLVKVGNLTGAGVSWLPRDRNFVDPSTTGKRYSTDKRVIRAGDIVMTSSAHSPKYIAKKIDVITRIPDWIGGSASFVGEVMLVRPNTDVIDPFHLAAYLRLPSVVEEIQHMIRGQTAHLHPDDLLDLEVEQTVLNDPLVAEELSNAIREEAELSERLNDVARRQILSAQSLSNEVSSTQLGFERVG